MLFPTTVFAVFFAIVFTLHWLLPEKSVWRKIALLAASVFFYAYWSVAFAVLPLASAVFNHAAALFIARRRGTAAARRTLAAAIALNLALLAFFKYAMFLFAQCFMPLAMTVAGWFGEAAVESLADFAMDGAYPFLGSVILPIGISFFTFQAIAYLVDVSRGTCAPAATLLDFVNSQIFFPKLVSGPLVKPADFIPQMETLPAKNVRLETGRAATLLLVGLFKKTVVANFLSLHLADPVFNDPESFGAVDALLGVYGYALQLYCDFSAYTDMAIGCALLLGFKLPDNFHAPYIATSLQDFWRRWHISLSSWLRDYLYIPMGGSRCAAWKIYRNLLCTMLLGGLWHGAGWAFILWGFIHGAGQCVERLFRGGRKAAAPTGFKKYLGMFVTFQVVCVAWIFFRAGAPGTDGLVTVKLIFQALANFSAPATLLSGTAVAMLLLAFAVQAFDGATPRRIHAALDRLPAWAQGLVFAAILTLVLGLGPSGVAPFLYFAF